MTLAVTPMYRYGCIRCGSVVTTTGQRLTCLRSIDGAACGGELREEGAPEQEEEPERGPRERAGE